MGAAADRPAPQAPPASKRGYDYQHFVCPWHWYTPAAARIEEWNFSGVYFDGLHPADCHLYEAKHGYDGFLETRDWSATGGPELRPWAVQADIQETVFEPMLRQGRNQHRAVLPHFGEVQLTWVFSHIDTRLYVGRLFLDGIDGWYHDMEVRQWTSG
ncbi:Tox-REase-5 domain-containing protein [Roseobacter weihaiensis]|uniref:Tox-REase-5 domain-containing protein n=1 Tax=Roseobacter weihaiensis TaxID=2763262 RepID=UPI001D09F09E|nr:Tox-REase-5 domain-containing protein [Roseobacter sp. H9]